MTTVLVGVGIYFNLVASLAKGEEIAQDVSTLENPAILEQLKQTVV